MTEAKGWKKKKKNSKTRGVYSAPHFIYFKYKRRRIAFIAHKVSMIRIRFSMVSLSEKEK